MYVCMYGTYGTYVLPNVFKRSILATSGGASCRLAWLARSRLHAATELASTSTRSTIQRERRGFEDGENMSGPAVIPDSSLSAKAVVNRKQR